MFFWRRVAPQIPEEGLKATATPGYTRNFRDLNDLVSRGKSFSGYERNPLFFNKRGQGFVEVAAQLGVDYDDDARAVARMDCDGDGDLDLWVTNRSAPQVRLLRNEQPSQGQYLQVRLKGNGTTTNRDAIGARVSLHDATGLQQLRTVRCGDGFLSQSTAWLHFGLGESAADLSMSVTWPDGTEETFRDVQPNQRYVLEQGTGDLREHGVAHRVWDGLTSTAQQSPPREGLWVASPIPFPVLNYSSPDGTARATTDLAGKPVLVNLWATWCTPCREELQLLAARSDELRAAGVEVLALNVDRLALDTETSASVAQTEALLDQLGYSLARGTAQTENLEKIEVLLHHLTSQRIPLSIPTSFLLDAAGNVVAVYLEPVSWEQLSQDLKVLRASSRAKLQRASPRPGRWTTDPRKAIDRSTYLGDYASLFGRSGFPEETQRLLQLQAGSRGSLSARDYYNQAKAATQQGNLAKAIQDYQRAIEINPDYGQALTGLGALLLQQRKTKEARQYLEKAISLDPNHATALVNLSLIDQAEGQSEQAMSRLQQVLSRNPEFTMAHVNLGLLMNSQQRFQDAIPHFQRAAELDPKLAMARIQLAQAYAKTKQWQAAEAQFRQVATSEPRMAATAYHGLGAALVAQQRWSEAVTAFDEAISAGGRTPSVLTSSGLAHWKSGDAVKARKAFEDALTLAPDFPPAKRGLAMLAEQE